jgi:hypothetical protein
MMADALAYLCERDPAVLLDSATLTDAAGLDLFAVLGNDREMVSDLLVAGVEAGDRGWEIPLRAPYRHLIDSEVADVKNVGDHDLDSTMMGQHDDGRSVPRDVRPSPRPVGARGQRRSRLGHLCDGPVAGGCDRLADPRVRPLHRSLGGAQGR